MHIQFRKRQLAFFAFLLIFSPQAWTDNWIYSIKEGDSLWKLTHRYLINDSLVTDIQKLNHISDPDSLLPNTKIKIPIKWIRHFSTPMRVRSVQGEVVLFGKDEEIPLALVSGVPILVGSSIQTSKNSSAVLEFSDGSLILLEENSLLNIELLEWSKTVGSHFRLHLKQGRLETSVNPHKKPDSRFEITTPVSLTSVRGTKYRVSLIPETLLSHTEVLEGGVDVSNQGIHQLIPKGFGTIVEANTPPKSAIKLLDAPNVDNVLRVIDSSHIQFMLPKLAKAQSYRVEIAKTVEFEKVLFNQVFLTEKVNILDFPHGEYYARIRGVDEFGLQGADVIFDFKVNILGDPPLASQLEFKATKNGKGVFIWPHNKENVEYHFQLSQTKNFSRTILDVKKILDSNLKLEMSLKKGKYFWRIAAVNKNGEGIFSDIAIFQSFPPTLKIDHTKIVGGHMVIRFNDSSVGKIYHVQIAKDRTFSTILFEKQLSDPELKVAIAEEIDIVYIRIRTIGKDGVMSNFSHEKEIILPKEHTYWLFLLIFLAVVIGIRRLK